MTTVGTILKIVACVSLLWLVFYIPEDDADTQFLKGMLDGMGDSVVAHPSTFSSMQDVESYRDRVVTLAREKRGSIPASDKIGELVGDQLNGLPFVLTEQTRAEVGKILKQAAGEL